MHATTATISGKHKHEFPDRLMPSASFDGDPAKDMFTFSFGWTCSIELVTKGIAKAILDTQNEKNRKYVRKLNVEKLRREMDAGNFITTPEGLIFDSDDNLIDGQHRLLALLRSSIDGLWFIVWRNVRPLVFEKINRNIPRSYGDANRTSRPVQDVINLIARLRFGNDHSHTENKIVLDAFHDLVNWLYSVPFTKRRAITQAPIRAAVVLRSAQDRRHADWLLAQYEALIHLDYNLMENSVQALCRQITNDGTKSWDLLVRAWRAFDFPRRNNGKIQIKDTSGDYADMRETINKMIGG